MDGVGLPGRLGDLEDVADVGGKVRGAREEPWVVRRGEHGMGGVLLEGALEGAGVGEGADAVLAMAGHSEFMMYSLVNVPK